MEEEVVSGADSLKSIAVSLAEIARQGRVREAREVMLAAGRYLWLRKEQGRLNTEMATAKTIGGSQGYATAKNLGTGIKQIEHEIEWLARQFPGIVQMISEIRKQGEEADKKAVSIISSNAVVAD